MNERQVQLMRGNIQILEKLCDGLSAVESYIRKHGVPGAAAPSLQRPQSPPVWALQTLADDPPADPTSRHKLAQWNYGKRQMESIKQAQANARTLFGDVIPEFSH